MTLTAAWIATVEKIGPSSEASAESQSCSRRLTVLSAVALQGKWRLCLGCRLRRRRSAV